jgi:branched-chain amino acid transport system substrate-binding protein
MEVRGNCCQRWRATVFIAGIALQGADINVGVTLSATGPAASLGIPEKNTFELAHDDRGPEDQLDHPRRRLGNDEGVTNTKLISEDKVDVIVLDHHAELARHGRRAYETPKRR